MLDKKVIICKGGDPFMIRAIIVDDEILSLELMERKLIEVGGIEVIKTFSDAESVINELRKLDFQVAFLDIEMTGLSGLDLAELIQEWDNSIHIVFVTAYRDYAIQAFELHSLDYLLKPVSKNRLEKTMTRIKKSIQINKSEHFSQNQSPQTILSVICFGEFVVYHQEEPVKWKTAKVKELFAFFITHLHTYVNRDTIIHSLWPELDYKKAKILLHTCISHLRKTLDSLGFSQTLKFSNQSYILEMDDFYCDAIELERAINNYRSITLENIDEVEKAIHLYIGLYMENNGYEWAEKKAQIINQQLFQLVQKVIDYYTAIKEHDKTLLYLHMFLEYNPYSEQTLKQLMLYHIQIGNRGEAVKVYYEFTDLLQEELGISPDKSTKTLYESIINTNYDA